MKPIPSSSTQFSSLHLRSVIDGIAKKNLQAAVQHRSFFINDICPLTNVDVDASRVCEILAALLDTSVVYSNDSSIRLTTGMVSGNCMQVNISIRNLVNSFAMACAMQKLISLVEKTSYQISITNRKHRHTTISFMFPVSQPGSLHILKLQGAA